nr:uncharacterized protein LOC117468025 [Pseudochaenichthys georgianus]
MELETAMAKAFDEMSTNLTPQIITGEGNTVFHSEWDNLNRITTNIHGSNVVNSAGGIMIQEVKESHVSTKKRTLPLYDRSSKMRNLKITPPETLPELAFKRVDPKFPKNANFTPPAENQVSYDASMLQYNTHLLSRWLSSQGKQQVQTSEFYELRSNQEETDSRIVLYLHQAVKWGYKSSVVRTPDTDILMILLYHASRINLSIYLDHGSGKHRTLINVTELSESLGPDYCSTLLGFYVFTGEDCTSAFKGKGKVNPLKKLEKTPKLHKAFRQLGADWMVTDELQEEMESFTCIMYGQARMTSVDTVRVKMMRKMVGADKVLDSKSQVDLERLPPPKVCLIPHVQRANYRVAFYKRADKAIIESPKPHDPGMGWEKTGEEEVLEPVWAIGPILPPSLVEVLAQRVESEEHAALDKVTDYANNNLSVGEVNGEYEHEDEELEMEEIELEDLFSDDEDDE